MAKMTVIEPDVKHDLKKNAMREITASPYDLLIEACKDGKHVKVELDEQDANEIGCQKLISIVGRHAKIRGVKIMGRTLVGDSAVVFMLKPEKVDLQA